MRVLFVNPAAGLGGSERSLLDVLSALGEAAPRLERSLLLLAEGELAERAKALGVTVEVLPLPPGLERLGESKATSSATRRPRETTRAALDALGYARRFRKSVQSRSPSLVHTNGMKAHLLAATATPELRRLVHFRDFASQRPLSRRLLPVVGWRALVVTNSRAVERDVLATAPSLRTRVIYNGIDTDAFRPGPPSASLAALSGLAPAAPGTLRVGLVATYAWWKGHRLFLEAAERVLAAEPGRAVRFYVVGGRVYRTAGSQIDEAELRRIMRERGLEGSVGLVPFQSDAAAVYRDLDVVVQASEQPEPFGRTIVEAMASGLAVVVSRAGGAAELFTEGRDGLGFEPRDASDLARAVLSLLREPALRARLGSAAREAALTRFDRRRLGPELLAAYGDLLGRKVS